MENNPIEIEELDVTQIIERLENVEKICAEIKQEIEKQKLFDGERFRAINRALEAHTKHLNDLTEYANTLGKYVGD